MAVSVPRYTVDDLDAFPEDGNRYELLDGILLVTPGPRPAHQVVASRLLVHLTNALGSAAQVVGPGAISAPPLTQLEPDILVFPAHLAVKEVWVDVTEHWLAVEILSRSSRIYDREFKRAAYFALGVPQVWLVDIDDRSVEVWTAPDHGTVLRDELEWTVPVIGSVLRLSLHELFGALS